MKEKENFLGYIYLFVILQIFGINEVWIYEACEVWQCACYLWLQGEEDLAWQQAPGVSETV